MPTEPFAADSEAAREEVEALALRRWSTACHLLRLRLTPAVSQQPGPRFQLVLNLRSGLVVVDPGLARAWGQPSRRLRRSALRGAAQAVRAAPTSEVTHGIDRGSLIRSYRGGVGTAALILDPTWLHLPAPTIGDTLAVLPDDRLLVIALPARDTPPVIAALAGRLRPPVVGLDESTFGDPVVFRRSRAGRLAIFESEGP